MSVPGSDLQDLVQQRQKKLKQIADFGFELYPRKWEYTHTLPAILAQYLSHTAEQLETQKVRVRVAGRVVTIRPHGKAGFAHLTGGGVRLQIYVRLDAVGDRDFALLVCDKVETPTWKNIDFLGASDAQDGWLVQGMVPHRRPQCRRRRGRR